MRADHDILVPELGVGAVENGDDVTRGLRGVLHLHIDRRGAAFVAEFGIFYGLAKHRGGGCGRDREGERTTGARTTASAGSTRSRSAGRRIGRASLVLHRVIEDVSKARLTDRRTDERNRLSAGQGRAETDA